MSINVGQCVVCDARIPAKSFDQLSPTCDKTCTRASRSGLTRGQQIEQETIQGWRYWAERHSEEAWAEKKALADLEDQHYNRPYLLPNYA